MRISAAATFTIYWGKFYTIDSELCFKHEFHKIYLVKQNYFRLRTW